MSENSSIYSNMSWSELNIHVETWNQWPLKTGATVMSTIHAPWNKLLPMHDHIHKSHLVVKKNMKEKYSKISTCLWANLVCYIQRVFHLWRNSLQQLLYSNWNSKWKEIRMSEETSHNVLFYFQVLENSHNLLTTIKANVLAIYNPKHFRTKICVRAACSRSLLCVLNGKHFGDKKHYFCVLTMELSMNHKAIQSLSIQIFHSTLYISCLFINKQHSAI